MLLPLSPFNMPEPWAQHSQQELDAQSRDATSAEVASRLLASAQQPPDKAQERVVAADSKAQESDRAITSSTTADLASIIQSLTETAQRLHDAKAQEFKSDKNLQRFKDNIQLFDKRIHAAGLSEAEERETLSQVLRLLDPKQSTTIGEKERMMLAQQVMRQAAKPSESIGLGKHFTCSAQAVEERVYLHAPSKAAKLVADIALNNQFVTADGTTIMIDLDSLKPDEESKLNPPMEGTRSYASHVFAMTALNTHWNRVTVDPTGKPTDVGAFRFAQMPKYRGDKFKAGEPYFDRGERLIDMRTTPPTIINDGPLIDISSLPDIYKQVTGSNESGFVAENKAHCSAPSICVDSTESLQSVLRDAKARGALPLLLRIHTGNDEFIDADKTGDWHVVSILDINPEKKEAFVSDQAGPRWDKFIKFDRLYRATLDPPVRFHPNAPLLNPNSRLGEPIRQQP